MSNALKRKPNKNKRRRKEQNSWPYVLWASLIDTVFSFSAHESLQEESIFDLSANLGELGRRRQEKRADRYRGSPPCGRHF